MDFRKRHEFGAGVTGCSRRGRRWGCREFLIARVSDVAPRRCRLFESTADPTATRRERVPGPQRWSGGLYFFAS